MRRFQSSGGWRPHSTHVYRGCLAVVLLLAASIRIFPWFLPHVFVGVMEYDDGVYYAASSALLHGQVPYRDFVILHPPGSTIALLPFAAAGSVFGDSYGLAAARVGTVVISLANIFLVSRIASGALHGAQSRAVAALLSAFTYAAYTNAVQSEHTFLLEPLLNLICLISVYVLLRARRTRRDALLVGIGLAVATLIKVFAAAYVIAVVVWYCASHRGKDAVATLLTYVAALSVLMVPWTVVAGASVWRDLVQTQLGRPPAGGMSGTGRGSDILGLTGFLGHPAPAGTVILSSVLLLAWLVWMCRADHRAWLSLTVLLVAVPAFLLSGPYFSHYSAFLAPSLAIALGRAGAQFSDNPSHRLPSSALVATAALYATFLLVGAGRPLLKWSGQGDIALAVERVVPQQACIFTDAQSLAVAANRLATSSRSCPQWVDGRGYALTLTGEKAGDFYPNGFQRLARWQHETVVQLQTADYLLLRGRTAALSEWDSSTRDYVHAHFRLVDAWTGDWPWQIWSRINSKA